MSNGIFSVRRMPVTLALALPLLALLGCTGSAGNPASGVLGTITNTIRANTLMVRVVNGTSANVETEIRVDGEIKILPVCTAQQRSCDYVLSNCPQTVELIQETRRDIDGAFMGGRNFEGNPDFIFTAGEFQCGERIIFQFTDSEASADVM